MANKLYEENSIRAVAERIRLFSNNKSRTYTVSQMAQGVLDACQDQYEKGRDSGFDAGIEYVKTTEARTGEDVVTIVEVPNRSVEVSVTGGYYPQETVVNVDVTSVYNEGYNEGYSDGHSDGYEDGLVDSGGTDPLLEEMLVVTDENYDDEGKQFYSVYKWLGLYHSNFSSYPWMLELENGHPTLWLHVYVWVDGMVNAGYDEETGNPFYDYVSHNYVLTLEPDYGVNSIEEEMNVTSFRIEGVRWSTDGV